MFKLLSTANPKIQKGTKQGYLSFILHLAPADLSGKETCPKRTVGCTAACLNTAGRGGMFKKGENTNMIQKARIRKTKYFFEDRDAFMLDLAYDIQKAIRFAERKGLTPVFRLNGTSDLAGRSMKCLCSALRTSLNCSLMYSSMTTLRSWAVRLRTLRTTT